MNMAIDETLLQQAKDMPVLRLYDWDRPAVSIGYFQHFTAASENGRSVVRRPTGGGIVFHDHDLTFTLVVPKAHPVAALSRTESYRLVNGAVADALAGMQVDSALVKEGDGSVPDPAGARCFENPVRFDVVSGTAKLAGGAQRRSAAGLLHQGSIAVAKLPGHDPEAVKAALIQSFAAVFNSPPATFTDVKDCIDTAQTLAADKYETDSWNRKR